MTGTRARGTYTVLAAQCISCGCTDDHACSTSTGPCWWVIVERDRGTGLCSGCATLEQLLVRVLPLERDNPDGATVREIAEHLGRRRDAVWEALLRLERKQLAERGGVLTSRAQVWYRAELEGLR